MCHTVGMKTAVVVGFGRFGALLGGYLRASYDVKIVEPNPAKAKEAAAQDYAVITPETIKPYDIIFLCVPISSLGSTAKELAPYISDGQVVADVCSVKVYPIAQLQEQLPHTCIIGTHPMFGPDSAAHGLDGLRLALCPVSAPEEAVQEMELFWSGLGVHVIRTTPEAHDKDAAYSQAFTYTIARMLLAAHAPGVTFTTRSYDKLLDIAEISRNDSDQLFHDMLAYNPFAPAAITALRQSCNRTFDEIERIYTNNQYLGAADELATLTRSRPPHQTTSANI